MQSRELLSVLCMASAAIATISAAHAAETITYKYDAKGRLIEVKRTGTVNNNVTTTYTHDKANNRKTVVVTGSGYATPAP
jgi:YD repeat-containing protein